MSIIYLGDIHGDLRVFDRLRGSVDKDDLIIQVGDFGVSNSILVQWRDQYSNLPCPVYFIDGNHENFDIVDSWGKGKVSEVAPGLFYVPRGLVLTLQGQRIGFLGGGPSIDKAWRREGRDWFPQEVISDEDVDKLVENAGSLQLDVLVTHIAPEFMNLRHFGKLDLREWQLPPDWTDHCSKKVAMINDVLNPKLHVCGHMHRDVRDGNMKILDIFEAWVPGYM